MRYLLACAYIIICLIFASSHSVWASETTPHQKFDQIIKSGVLRVGVALFTPWAMKGKKGELEGFEIDVAKKLSQDMGVTPKLTVYDWNELIPALKAGKIDIIISGISITPTRALSINFSNPYDESGVGFATNIELTKHITKIEELNRKSINIGVISTTVAESLARKVFDKATIRVFQKSDEARDAVVSGKIHAYLESYPIPQFIALEHPEKIDVPLSEPLLITKTGFAINKSDPDFLNFLNSWIVFRDADTWLESTHSYWFETLQWK